MEGGQEGDICDKEGERGRWGRRRGKEEGEGGGGRRRGKEGCTHLIDLNTVGVHLSPLALCLAFLFLIFQSKMTRTLHLANVKVPQLTHFQM